MVQIYIKSQVLHEKFTFLFLGLEGGWVSLEIKVVISNLKYFIFHFSPPPPRNFSEVKEKTKI